MGVLSRLFGGSKHESSGARLDATVPGGFLVVDTETTGFSAQHDRIVEIAAVITDSAGRIVGEWTTRLNPEGPVGATHIHGISDADVVDAPKFVEVASDVISLARGRALVCHNARFDVAFLRAELGRAGWPLPDVPTLCTLQASNYYLPELSRRRLPDCCDAARVRLTSHHTALADARATAGLLRYYLDPGIRPAPRPEHIELLERASRVAWPEAPGARLVADPPPARRRRAQATVTSDSLIQMLKGYSIRDAVDEGAPQGTVPYLELLLSVVEDGRISPDERSDLDDLIQTFGLNSADVRAAHEGFLVALAHHAVKDGRVSTEERDELKRVAGLLELPDKVVTTSLASARKVAEAKASTGLPPLPASWNHGEPLRVGQRVAFTGCDEAQRYRLEQAATEAGVRITSSVSKTTAMLVTDGGFDGTKAAAARELGTRIVHPDEFEMLVRHVQPAEG